MASLSGVSSSNTLSSLMNSANMISGLASGLDTEGMIESLVKSYQTKINQLNQKATKVEWKQDAYRSIINNLVNFSSRYTSYTSSTNLMSRSFFDTAVKVSTLGKYADAVSASGKTSSNISLNAVHQLAKSAQYRTSSNMSAGDGKSIEASKGIDLNGQTTLASLNGSMTLTYGNQNVTISFDQVSDVKAMDEIRSKLGAKATDADVLAELINQKMRGQTISLSGGKTADATERIQVTAQNGMISFSDKSTAGNSVFISAASDGVSKFLGIKDALDDTSGDIDKPTYFMVQDGTLKVDVDNKEYLSGRTMNMSLDGVNKTITLPKIISNDDGTFIEDTDGTLLDYNADNYAKVLNDAVQAAYKGKVEVTNKATDGSLQLHFEVQEGSNLIINAGVGETLGIGQIATSYLNTNKTLGELLGEGKLNALTPALDKDGNELLDADGNKMYTFEINGVKVGNYSKNSTLAELMSDINSSDAGVKVSYSETTKNFLFETKETGAGSEIRLGGGLAAAMFGEDHGDTKLSDLLGGDRVSRSYSFKIGEDSFSGSFDSNSETMGSLENKLNEILKEKGYTASYTKESGLVIRDSEGNAVDLEYEDDAGNQGNSVLRGIMEQSQQKAASVDYSKQKLADILGEDEIKGSKFEFTIDGETYTGSIASNDGTMRSMVNKLNGILPDEYEASYSKDTGLVITKNGKKVDVQYGTDEEGNDDILARLAKATEVKDYTGAKLTDVYGDDIVNVQELEFEVNGRKFTGRIESSRETMDDVLKDINQAMKDSGYTASYSSINGELVITDPQGREAKVEYDKGGTLGEIMDAYASEFKAADEKVYTKGQDAIFDVTVNGENIQMTRSSNSVNIDGLTVTMNDTFNSKNKVDDNGNAIAGQYEVDNDSESVSFKTSTDTDKIVDAIKSMVSDYNVMMAEIKSAYMTMPYQNSSGAFANYEPLTEDDMEGMTESAIARYEEKAKQGILFGDRTLSALYTKMNQAFSFDNRADVDALKEMGITVNYSVSDGTQAISIDEDKLRAMLDSDPDRVANLFTKSDGIMDRMKTQLDNYAKTTGEPKGILIQQAGSPLSPLSLLDNQWQNEINNYTNQIEKWQSKLQSQVERYTSQFARLEQLINQMNSQSSTLAGLMGGGSY